MDLPAPCCWGGGGIQPLYFLRSVHLPPFETVVLFVGRVEYRESKNVRVGVLREMNANCI